MTERPAARAAARSAGARRAAGRGASWQRRARRLRRSASRSRAPAAPRARPVALARARGAGRGGRSLPRAGGRGLGAGRGRPGRDDARAGARSLCPPGKSAGRLGAGPVDRRSRTARGAARAPSTSVLVAGRPVRGRHARPTSWSRSIPAARPRWSLARPGRVPRCRAVAGRLPDRLPERAATCGSWRVTARATPRWPRASRSCRRPGGPARGTSSPMPTERAGFGSYETDSRRTLWRSVPAAAPTQLAWSPDGRLLARRGAHAPAAVRRRGRLVSTLEMPAGTLADARRLQAHQPRVRPRLAQLMRCRGRLAIVRLGQGRDRRAACCSPGAGRFGDLGVVTRRRWLLATWPSANQWVFIRAGERRRGGIEKLLAVANIAQQFAPGSTAPAFPGLGGWCCALARAQPVDRARRATSRRRARARPRRTS